MGKSTFPLWSLLWSRHYWSNSPRYKHKYVIIAKQCSGRFPLKPQWHWTGFWGLTPWKPVKNSALKQGCLYVHTYTHVHINPSMFLSPCAQTPHMYTPVTQCHSALTEAIHMMFKQNLFFQLLLSATLSSVKLIIQVCATKCYNISISI